LILPERSAPATVVIALSPFRKGLASCASGSRNEGLLRAVMRRHEAGTCAGGRHAAPN